jgi:ketosteroid isomerase-like protein
MDEAEVARLLDEFGAAWNDHDLDRALRFVTDDVVFESTGPAPDGVRAVGPDEVREAWAPIFSDPSSHFETEDAFIAGDRATTRWIYRWSGGHIRGVDVFLLRDGKVAEKLSYVKG